MNDMSFVVFKGAKRLTIKEEDMNVSKIGHVFQINTSSCYLVDDTNCTVFPNDDGTFSSFQLTLNGHYAVNGDDMASTGNELASSLNNASTSQFSFAKNRSTTVSPSRLPTFQRPGNSYLRNKPQTQPGRHGDIVLSKTTKMIDESPVKNKKKTEYRDNTERRSPVQTQSANIKSEIRISKTTEPIDDVYDVLQVHLLPLSLTGDHREGSHEKLLILQHSTGLKVILKTIDRKENNCLKEVLAMVHLQKKVSPMVYFILETREKIYVYMECITPGVTLKDLLMKIPHIRPEILVELFHYIIYTFIQNLNIVWKNGWSHNDIHVENILMEESNRCLRTRLIDFGDAIEIEDESYINTRADVIRMYAVIKHMIDRKYWTDILLLNNPPEIDFQLDDYKQMKEEYLNMNKIKDLQKTVLPLATDFANDRSANKYIIDMFKEKRRCIIQ